LWMPMASTGEKETMIMTRTPKGFKGPGSGNKLVDADGFNRRERNYDHDQTTPAGRSPHSMLQYNAGL